MRFKAHKSLFFMFLLSLFVSCGSELTDDLEQDFNANYNFYAENPSESDDVSFVTVLYPIGSTITAFPTSKDSRFTNLKPGYKFDKWIYCIDSDSELPQGWENSSDGTIKTALVTSLDASFYVANWSPVEYDVVFNANGGSGEMTTQHFVYDVPQNLSENAFLRENYEFSGWGLSTNQSPNSISYSDQEEVSNLTTKDGDVLNFYALWLRDRVTVTYKGNGGTYTDESGSEISETSQILKFRELPDSLNPNPFEKEGHTFAAWNTRTDGKGTSYYDGSEITVENYPEDDTTLYALWNINYYAVTFDKNDGTSETETLYYAWNTKASKPEDPSRTGYDFEGWFVSSDCGHTFDSDTSYDFSTPVKDHIYLLAKWKIQTITIHFEKNSSTATGTMSDRTVSYSEIEEGNGYGNYVYLNCDFTPQDGYMFNGWSTTPSGNVTTSWGTNELRFWELNEYNWNNLRNNATGDVSLTFYALWDVQHWSVNFELPDGGEWTDTDEVKHQYLEAGSKATKPSDPVRTGYDFAGWFIESDYNNGDWSSPYDFNTSVTEYTSLYAHWTVQSVTVKYASNGGSGTISDQSFTYEETPVYLTANVFTRSGYNFIGWAKTSGASSAAFYDCESISESNWSTLHGSASGSAEVTLYAVWEIQKFTVTFMDSVSGDLISSQDVEYGGTITPPSDPSKSHYTFLGWDDSNSTPNSMESAANLLTPVTADRTLWAKWSPDTYTLTFNGNGATSGTMGTQTFTYGQGQTLTANAFSKVGYVFGGWSKSASSTSVAASDGQTVYLESDTTYYAIWQKRASVSGVNNLSVTIDEDNEQIIFTATGSYSSWTWLVDGVTVAESGDSLTISYDAYANGSNHFVLMIGVAEDGSIAESANFKILPQN